MKIKVTKDNVTIDKDELYHAGEYNIHDCTFEFSEEYTDIFVKKALFGVDNKFYEMSILNNQCEIPYDVLKSNGMVILGVYAYEVLEDKLKLRYSPMYDKFFVNLGSYQENIENQEEIRPTQFEQYMQALQNGLAEVQSSIDKLNETTDNANNLIDDINKKLESGEFDGVGITTITSGQAIQQNDNTITPITVNKTDGSQQIFNVSAKNGINGTDGTDGTNGQNGITPNLQIGTVTTLEPNEQATVTRTGTDENPILNFGIPKGQTYQVNEEDLDNIANEITSNANSSFNQNVKNKTDSFNENSSLKTNEFNNNAAKKTLDYNNNCISKTNSFNQNSTQKLTEFNDNYTSKLNFFNNNADLRMDEYNANADNKIAEYDEHSQELNNKIVDIENRLTDLEENVSKLIDDAPIYGIQRNIADNSDTAWERTDDAVGLVANATHDGTEVRNDFDNIYPWSHMKTVNYDPTEEMITATIGDSNFRFDGSNGQVMTIIPEFYLKHWDDGIKEHWQISRYALEGFTKVPGFMLGRYVSGRTADNKLMSASGLFPEVSRTITAFRTDSRAVGKDFGQVDWRYFVVQLLYLVEYADYNSQAQLGNGLVSLRKSDSDKALVAETNANRIIIGTANANYFKVGQAISIGTSSSWNWHVARNRIITSITDFSEGDITGKAINFDGSPVNIAIGNVVWSTGQKSGECDSLGMKSGCLANDSKSAVIYRGLESIFGNVWQFVDGINIKDYVAYVCYNPANYVVDKFDGDYNEIGYTNASTNGYGKTLGHDENHPLIMFPTEVGGSTNTYLSDYYNQNSGNRIPIVGGTWYFGAIAGLWSWNCYFASSNSYFSIGSRLLKSTI